MSRTIENPYENFIALSRYARWMPEENRRETWGETVDRYFNFMLAHLEKEHKYFPNNKIVEELKTAVFNRDVMPSMRSVAQELDSLLSISMLISFLPSPKLLKSLQLLLQ